MKGFIVETSIVALYVCLMIVTPVVLETNGLTSKLLSIPALPLLFFGVPDRSSVFNPAVIFAMWFVNKFLHPGAVMSFMQAEHLVAPLLGAVIGGLLCTKWFPDDSKTWIRRPYF
jgi:predicted MFS family arabinose efflux permease